MGDLDEWKPQTTPQQPLHESFRSWLGLLASTGAVAVFFGEIAIDRFQHVREVTTVVVTILTARAFQKAARSLRVEVISENPKIPSLRIQLGEASSSAQSGAATPPPSSPPISAKKAPSIAPDESIPAPSRSSAESPSVPPSP